MEETGGFIGWQFGVTFILVLAVAVWMWMRVRRSQARRDEPPGVAGTMAAPPEARTVQTDHGAAPHGAAPRRERP